MKFYQKRSFALVVVLVLAILGSWRLRHQQKARRPAPGILRQLAAGRRRPVDGRDGGLPLRQYDQSWDSNYRAIIAVATLDTLNGWTYEKAAAELGPVGLGGNYMLLLLVKRQRLLRGAGRQRAGRHDGHLSGGTAGRCGGSPYYQGDYDAAALAFFRQADVFYAQTLGRQQSGGSYSDYEG